MDHLLRNAQTMPPNSIIPVLAYKDVDKAIAWLCDVFGFTIRWRAGSHRAQLNFGNSTIVVTAHPDLSKHSEDYAQYYSLMVRVADVDDHYDRVVTSDAVIISKPQLFPYGEKQYSVQDIDGHHWMFSSSVNDKNVEEWGGSLPG